MDMHRNFNPPSEINRPAADENWFYSGVVRVDRKDCRHVGGMPS